MSQGRDRNGRFAKGHSGNPNGRLPRKREERFMEIMLSAVTFKDWRAIVKKAVEQASTGDAQARKFLADYIIGTPPQRHEHSGRDGEDLVFLNLQLQLMCHLLLLKEIGVSCEELDYLVKLTLKKGAFGAKLTGGGGGGCMVALTPNKKLQEKVASAVENESFKVLRTKIGIEKIN